MFTKLTKLLFISITIPLLFLLCYKVKTKCGFNLSKRYHTADVVHKLSGNIIPKEFFTHDYF